MIALFGILSIVCLITFLAIWDKSYSKVADRILVVTGFGAIIFAVLTLVFGIIDFIQMKKDNRYTTTATGVNEVTIRTDDDEVVWRVLKEDIEKGKKYEVTFDTKGTNRITDDEIIEIKEIK